MKSEIFHYEWLHAGSPSRTWVEMGYSEPDAPRDQYPYLLTLHISAPSKNNRKKMGRIAQFRSRRVVKKLRNHAETSSVLWVGERHYGCAREVFYYGETEDSLRELAAQAASKALSIEYELIHDAQWNAYFNTVYPSASQKQIVKNRIWCERMKKSGDNSNVARRINHYLSFYNERARLQFEGLARSAGFALGEPFFAAEAPRAYGICVHQRCPLHLDAINNSTTRLIEVAQPLEGYYDYWDCALMPRR
jgi:Protein of unknown function (DUF1260).